MRLPLRSRPAFYLWGHRSPTRGPAGPQPGPSHREGDAKRAADGYEKAYQAANDLWRVGAGSMLDLEVARRIAVSARIQLLGVQRERVAAWIGLYRAAGGGWLATDRIDGLTQ